MQEWMNEPNFPETIKVSKTGRELKLSETNKNLVTNQWFGKYNFDDKIEVVLERGQVNILKNKKTIE